MLPKNTNPNASLTNSAEDSYTDSVNAARGVVNGLIFSALFYGGAALVAWAAFYTFH